jgi:hypothetical protein
MGGANASLACRQARCPIGAKIEWAVRQVRGAQTAGALRRISIALRVAKQVAAGMALFWPQETGELATLSAHPGPTELVK